MNDTELSRKAFLLREQAAGLIYRGKSGHIGSDFSVMDILVTLFYLHLNVSPAQQTDPSRDRFILSKGHTAEALYCILCDKGFFPKEELETFCQFGSKYTGHPNKNINGVEINSGSLGHGLPVGVGMALAGRMQGQPYRVYVVMGDGELAEGSVWEGAMAASHFKLDNLIVIIDRNRLQISGTTESVMNPGDLRSRFESFGWQVWECPGNRIDALDQTISEAKASVGAPALVIANTIKGYGYSAAENQAKWHHKVPSEEEYQQILEELKERRAMIE